MMPETWIDWACDEGGLPLRDVTLVVDLERRHPLAPGGAAEQLAASMADRDLGRELEGMLAEIRERIEAQHARLARDDDLFVPSGVYRFDDKNHLSVHGYLAPYSLYCVVHGRELRTVNGRLRPVWGRRSVYRQIQPWKHPESPELAEILAGPLAYEVHAKVGDGKAGEGKPDVAVLGRRREGRVDNFEGAWEGLSSGKVVVPPEAKSLNLRTTELNLRTAVLSGIRRETGLEGLAPLDDDAPFLRLGMILRQGWDGCPVAVVGADLWVPPLSARPLLERGHAEAELHTVPATPSSMAQLVARGSRCVPGTAGAIEALILTGFYGRPSPEVRDSVTEDFMRRTGAQQVEGKEMPGWSGPVPAFDAYRDGYSSKRSKSLPWLPEPEGVELADHDELGL